MDIYAPSRYLRRFLFGTHYQGEAKFVSVEARDKDHAVERLTWLYPQVEPTKWDYVDEVELHHRCGIDL